MHYSTTYPSPVGLLTLACDRSGGKLIGLWIEGQRYHGSNMHAKMIPNNDIKLLETTKDWLDRYFAGEKPVISELPLAPIGSEFSQEVWNILREIPYGEVIPYGEIARKLAAKMGKASMSSQAVGGAVGHNPISIIIPCHRVVGSNGSMTGFSAGVTTKSKLLELEGVDTSRFFVPKNGTAL